MHDLAASTAARALRDYRALREAAALLDLAGWTVLRLEGPDAAEFLNATGSQELRSTPPGAVVPTLFLTEKGRPVALAWVSVEPGGRSAIVIADEGARSTLRPHLERLRVMEEVEIAGPEGMPTLLGAGGAARDELAGSAAARMGGAVVLRGDPITFILASPAQARGPSTAPSAAPNAGSEPPAEPAEPAAFEAWRIAVGLPLTGIDFDDERIATELELPAAISLTKGCYVGQETVARTTARGRVRRRRVGFRFRWEGARIVPRSELRAGGICAGFVTSNEREPGSSDGLGMGYLAADILAEPVSVLAVEGAKTTHVKVAGWPL